MPDPQPTAVILTTHPIEYKAVRIHLDNLQEETHPQGTIYERGIFTAERQNWQVGIVQIASGNSSAAIAAERAIAYFQPAVVFFVGTAPGLKGIVPGDIVVATKVYDYESGQAYGTSFRSQPEIGKSSFRLIERAKAEARKTDWQRRIPDSLTTLVSSSHVHIGPIAAGEKIISSPRSEVLRLIQTTFGDTLAIEMEGKGFLLAAHENEQIQALIVRGIVEHIAAQSPNHTLAAQTIAAHHASAFAFEILARLDAQSATSARTLTDLHLVDLYINEEDDNPLLDITLHNSGSQDALPIRARIDILDTGEFHYADENDIEFSRLFLVPTHTYQIELSPSEKGKSKTIKIAHRLIPGETERFQLVIDQTSVPINLAYVWYYLKIAVIYNYNRQELTLHSMPFLLSFPPVDVHIDTIWQANGNLYTQNNRATLKRMASLQGKKSSSIEETIRRFL